MNLKLTELYVFEQKLNVR